MKALKLTLILMLFPLVSFAGGSDGGPGVLQPILMDNAISLDEIASLKAFDSEPSVHSDDHGWVEYDKYLIKFVSISKNESVRFLVDDGETILGLNVNEEVLSEDEDLVNSLELSQEVSL